MDKQKKPRVQTSLFPLFKGTRNFLQDICIKSKVFPRTNGLLLVIMPSERHHTINYSCGTILSADIQGRGTILVHVSIQELWAIWHLYSFITVLKLLSKVHTCPFLLRWGSRLCGEWREKKNLDWRKDWKGLICNTSSVLQKQTCRQHLRNAWFIFMWTKCELPQKPRKL